MISSLLGVVLLGTAVSQSAPLGPSPAEVNWPAFLARHDLRHARLPESWDRGAFLGNGKMGAMVYRDRQAIAFELGDAGITDYQPTQSSPTGLTSPMFVRPRLPIGSFLLEPAGEIVRGTMRLDLWNAELRSDIETTRGKIHVRAYVHASRPLLVVELELEGGEVAISHTFKPALAISDVKMFRRISITPSDINPAPLRLRSGDNYLSVQTRNTGGAHGVGWRESGKGKKRTIFLSIADADSIDRAKQAITTTLDGGSQTSGQALRTQHQAFWHSYYPKSFLSIPDTRLEGFYFLQMYKLAAAARSDGPAIDTLGPWYRRTPWPGIWWNLNLQLSYWPLYTANRLDIAESLLSLIDRNHATLKQNSGYSDAAAIGRTSAQDARSPVTDNDAAHRPEHELGNLMWALHNYWLHYRHTMDDAMLRDRLYPLLKESANYFLHILREDAQGILHTPKAISPEYTTAAEDTNYDLSLLRWGLSAIIGADARLQLHDPDVQRYRRVLTHLAPYPRGPNGYDIGKGVPLAESHRHFSHLLMIYPLATVTPDSAENRTVIEKSLAHWIGFEGALQGYSFVGASAISSLLGKGDDALSYLNQLLSRFVKRNTMYLEAGPVIETPLAAAQAIHEMLLQGRNGVVRIFPALPSSFEDVTFAHLRVEGAFLVSAERRKGKTQFVAIQSQAGEPLVLALPFEDAFQLAGSRPFALSKNADRTWRVDLKKGESIVIGNRDVGEIVPRIVPVKSDERGEHAFGVRSDNPLLPRPAAALRPPSKRVTPSDTAPRIAVPDGVIRDFQLRKEAVNTVYANNGWEEIAWAHLDNEVPRPEAAGPIPWWTEPREREHWQPLHSDKDCIDLTAFRSEKPAGAIAYLATTIVSPRRQTAVMHLGSSDAARVELWGQRGIQIFESGAARKATPRQDHFPVELRAGRNPLLFKIINDQGDWGGCLEITAADGSKLSQLSVDPVAP